jgi:predicted nuclease with TOPRIM domain
MDTLTIVREIIDLAAERDELREQRDSLIASHGQLQERNITQAALIDAQREALAEARPLQVLVSDQARTIEQLRAKLDAARSPASVTTAAPAVMTREQILSVAREALATGRQVRATLINNAWEGDCGTCIVTTTIYAIDDSSIPVALTRETGSSRWCFLAHERDDDSEALASLELV